MSKYKRYVKHTCQKCGLNYRKMYNMKNGLSVCWKCSRKDYNKMRIPYANPRITLQEALDRVYEVRGYLSKNNYPITHVSIPTILIGRKFKIVLVKK
jgi:hypothetical protein